MTSSEPGEGVERLTIVERLAREAALHGGRALLQTPSQTVGPFFAFGLPFDGGPYLVEQGALGAVRLHGVVLDGADDPVPDAIVELWQPDAHGVIARTAGSRQRALGRFTGFGRTAVEVDGSYEFRTVLPGATGAGPSWALVTVFARGLLHHLFTRAYFVRAGEPLPTDAFLESVSADRRSTLFALEEEIGAFRFDIRLQGAGETVFLDYPAGTGA